MTYTANSLNADRTTPVSDGSNSDSISEVTVSVSSVSARESSDVPASTEVVAAGQAELVAALRLEMKEVSAGLTAVTKSLNTMVENQDAKIKLLNTMNERQAAMVEGQAAEIKVLATIKERQATIIEGQAAPPKASECHVLFYIFAIPTEVAIFVIFIVLTCRGKTMTLPSFVSPK